MGMLRKAVFWLTMLFFVFFAAVEAISLPECNQLKEEMLKDKLNFINCADKKMMIPEVNNTYPVADFSNFTQEEFDNMTDVKTILGKPEPDQNEHRLFCGNFLAKNSDLTNIKLGFYVVKQDGPPQSFVLESNHHLENVTITTTTIDKDFHLNMTFIIKNNKRLSNESLEALRAIDYYNNKTSYIQQFGECDLDTNGISSLKDLQDCHYLVNDLAINRETVLAATKALDLKEVKGCIRIENTEIKDLNVISTITKTNCSGSHEIVNNKNLCLHPEEISKLKKRLGKVDYKNNSDCLKNCSAHYFLSEKDPLCENIKGDLEITGFNDISELDYFKNIVSIQGHIKVHNNYFNGIPFLKNLKEVGNGCESGPAIDIYDNENLSELELTALKQVNCPYLSTWLVVRRNSGKLLFSLQQLIILSQQGLVDIPAIETGLENVRFEKKCNSICDSRYQSNKDLCCVHNRYKKFFGCLLVDGNFKAYCRL